MRSFLGSFYARLSALFLALVLSLGAGCIAIAFRAASHLFDDVEQLLNRDTARSIAGELAPLVADGLSPGRIGEALHYMMVLNPMVEIYLLDGGGRILSSFVGPGEEVQRRAVAIAPVRAFVASDGHRLLLGEDPRSAARSRPFSAAPLRIGEEAGYVYVILGGVRYDASLAMIRDSYYLRAGFVALLLAVLATVAAGLALFFLLTRRLRALADAVEGIADGDMTRRVPATGGDEIGALGRRFNAMADAVAAGMRRQREAERQRREMVGNVSHDLRSPLAAARAHLETVLLRDAQMGPEERRSMLSTSLRGLDGLQRLVDELFALARLDAGQSPRLEEVPLAELARDAASAVRARAAEDEVRVDCTTSEGLPLVHCDPLMIERVIVNLLDNAVRHAPRGGWVRLGVAPEGPGVRVTVEDNGPGIAREDLPHLFERFWRSDSSRGRATGGAGLGLAIARQVVELHGGTLGADNAPGAGARFAFVLPVAGPVA